jgi:hypothetical protein
VKRPLRHDEVALWAKVAATVRPAAGRSVPVALVQTAPPTTPSAKAKAAKAAKGPHPNPPRAATPALPGPRAIEPGRMRRIAASATAWAHASICMA